MTKPSTVFFGSFQQYSAQLLKFIHTSNLLEVNAVITTPPKPAGRKQIPQKTPVHKFAQTHHIPVFTPENLDQRALNTFMKITKQASPPDMFVVAGYGKLLPGLWLDFPTIAPVNIHFSLLPKYRGAMPGEWAILMGDTHTGVSLIEMSPHFDTGAIYAQAQIPISSRDTRETLYSKLYTLGAQTFLQTLPHYLSWKTAPKHESKFTKNNTAHTIFLPPKIQPTKSPAYAPMLTKTDAHIPWSIIQKAIAGKTIKPTDSLPPLLSTITQPQLQNRDLSLDISYSSPVAKTVRALSGWPGVWTTVQTKKGKKRLKLHTTDIKNHKLVIKVAQLESQTKKPFSQIKDQIIS